jgi:hypothetical protein
VFGGKLLSKARKEVADTTVNTFIYDVKGYAPEIESDIATMLYAIQNYRGYTKVIEERTAKPNPIKKIEQFRQLARRHGYAFLL